MGESEFGVGQLIGAFFGALFVVLNGGLLGSVGHLVAAVLAVAAVVLVVLAYLRGRRATGSAGTFEMTRSYRIVVGVEIVALFGGLAVLGRVAPQLNVPWIVLVVGLHFLAFARWWPDGAGIFRVLGAVMVVLAVAGGVVGVLGGPESAPVAHFVSGFLTGVVMLLWLAVPAVRRLRTA
ncbi:hypothetical protein [Actinomycetospora soli]|uniref:hypothetical protein n=1 Tax=Actinomycetospora soli TaxID=2893887 RepID=UPI001E330208|nr:hypothetical protein [Actinomycetospora soli]MCD2187389.1 hypothetical protein [Actinomycetospora soli]